MQKVIIDHIKEQIKTDDLFLETSLSTLFTYQTLDEQVEKHTKHKNAMGFNQPDSNSLSDYTIWILSGKHLHGEYLEDARRRMDKYSGQLSHYKEITEVLNKKVKPETLINSIKIRDDVSFETIPEEVITLDEWVNFKIKQREEERKERERQKREEEKIERARIKKEKELEQKRFKEEQKRKWKETEERRLRELYVQVRGEVKQITEKALRIYIFDHKAEHWFPKFKIVNGYKKNFNQNTEQEFWIDKEIYRQKEEELAEKVPVEIEGKLLEIRPKSIYIEIEGKNYFFGKFSVYGEYKEEQVGSIQTFKVWKSMAVEKSLLKREED